MGTCTKQDYLTMYIDFTSFYDFDIWFTNCSDSVVYLFFILLKQWYFQPFILN